MSLFKKLDKYISRQSQIKLLRHWSYKVIKEPKCYALYFEAEGGLGKTRLLEMYPQFIKKQISKMRIANIIDLYDYSNRNPNEIEQKLIDGLKKTDSQQWYREAEEFIKTAFKDYLELAATRGTTDAAQIVDMQLRQTFIKCWNKLAKEQPLVMRFDTVETLFGPKAPPDALINAAEAHSSAKIVSDWMSQVLPHLHHTLVLFSGRPIPAQRNTFVEQLHAIGVLYEPPQTLHPLTNVEDIRDFLAGYNLGQAPDDVAHIRRITEGRPLLLTCYREIDNGTIRISEGKKEKLATLSTKTDLENFIIDTILNPLAIHDLYGRTLALCLYFLSYARYGIRIAELRQLFDELNLEKDSKVFESLHEVALVRRVRSKTIETGIPEEAQDQGKDTLLLLHDEIYRLIDESKKLDVLSLRATVLKFLCDRSRYQVDRAIQHRTAVLKAMSEHMCYELTNDFSTTGYRTYVIYFDWLIRQRSTIAACILAEAFWSMFSTSTRSNGQIVYPFRQQLKQSNLRLTTILNDEQVRRIKLLRANDKYQLALDVAESTYGRFVQRGILPGDSIADPAKHDLYLLVELNLERAIGLMTLLRPGYEQAVESIFNQLTQTLASPNLQGLLPIRKSFFLGQIYMLRSQLYTHQQCYTDAIDTSLSARQAFLEYREKIRQIESIPDDLRTDLGQIINNIAINFAHSGRLDEAQQLAEELVTRYSEHALDYRQTLFNVTYVRILLRCGNLLKAKDVLKHAENAAENSSSDRARGLVQFAKGMLERRQMNVLEQPNPNGIKYFVQAQAFLQSEPSLHQEVHYEWSRYLRDLGWFYALRNDTRRQYEYQQQALDQVDQALRLLSEAPAMQRADLLETKASIYNNIGNYAEAIELLQQAADLLEDDLPAYAHVVAGKIALQQGLIALFQRGDNITALRSMTIALARAYFFAPRHRDQSAFEYIIQRILHLMPPHDLQEFIESRWHVEADELPHPIPDKRHSDKWNKTFRKSLQCVKNLIWGYQKIEERVLEDLDIVP